MAEQAVTEAWSVQRVLRWAAQDFEKRGSPSARLDAEVLLAHVLGVERIRLFVEPGRALTPAELSRYREAIQRRRADEPVAYIIGHREFYGLDFLVDRRVLIPRPDTEALVEVALERTRTWSLYGRAVDLCTGSGCVAIAFARQRPTWEVTGIDLDPGTIELARDNALRLGTVHGVCFLASDLFTPLAAGERFDLVTCNPPYVPTEEYLELDRGIRDFEPRLALDGGKDGLVLTRRVVEACRERLVPGGVLCLEVGSGQATEVAGLCEAAGLTAIQRQRDYGGHERVVSGRWG
jgi:release factor glutamine methyltransferase